MNQFDYDVAVLGGGSAGYAAARTAAGAGLKTAVIEGGEEVGGLCILRGCMPTKALLYAAEIMHLARHAGTWGLRAEKASFDFAKVMARKDALIRDFADYRRQQLAGGKFKFIRANARFGGFAHGEINPSCRPSDTLSPQNGERDGGEGAFTKDYSEKFHHRHRLACFTGTVAATEQRWLHHQ